MRRFTYKIPVLLLNLCLLMLMTGVSVGREHCPRYCSCFQDNLRSVFCVAKRLDSIDLAVPTLVQRLNLSNNSISALDDRGFQSLGLVEIVQLILQYNSIRTIGLHSFAGLTYLEWVDLTGNSLYQILPWTFHDNNNLKFLSLSENPLGHIISSGPLLDIPSLEVLRLRNCNFAHFSEDAFSALPSLKSLDISQNQIINIDIFSLSYILNLKELDISENPCPCNINLENYLRSKMCKLVGSTCDLSTDLQEVNDINYEPVKLERMMSDNEVHPEYDDKNSDYDYYSDKTPKCNYQQCNCKSENITSSIYVEHLTFPPMWWMLCISFQLGICTTLFIGYCLKYCSKTRPEYQWLERELPVNTEPIGNCGASASVVDESSSVRHTSLEPLQCLTETMSCPETPPPTYRELFMTSDP